MRRRSVVLGMSGGIDSSVAAYLLKRQGWNILGVTITCSGDGEYEVPDGLSQAQRLCEKLGIQHRVLDARALFERDVIGYFIKSYAGGMTPNPCAVCNPAIKFTLLAGVMRRMTQLPPSAKIFTPGIRNICAVSNTGE